MKRIFTLISVAIMAISANAQSNTVTYDAVTSEGTHASEFAAVVEAVMKKDEPEKVDYYKATNAADGQSVVTITKGAATVTAVGGTTPANRVDPEDPLANVGQDITIGDVIDADAHTYKIASVNSWDVIKWNLGSQGDINFSYIVGSGVPYVDIYAKENSKDNVWAGNYKAEYTYYEPDGSKGMPLTGLYYKFTTTAKGAFKVKVFVNKGDRFTYVVNASTMKAQDLYASGYINGVNDAEGKKKLLSVAEVNAEHEKYIYSDYNNAVKKNEEEPGTYTQAELDAKKAACDELAVTRKYVIGNGKQNFWGWLTFDVDAGEEYWVFQQSSQLGFAGFEFVEGGKASELIDTSIKTIPTAEPSDNAIYNLSGQRVDDSYKGVVIQDGKKRVQ